MEKAYFRKILCGGKEKFSKNSIMEILDMDVCVCVRKEVEQTYTYTYMRLPGLTHKLSYDKNDSQRFIYLVRDISFFLLLYKTLS